MTEHTRWIDLDGAVNMRDLGGLPTRDGAATSFGRVLRGDNLQGLSAADIQRLTGDLALRDVIDLRTGDEVGKEGPGPLTRRPDVTIHHLSLFTEVGEHTDADADAAVDVDSALPWQDKPVSQEIADRSAGFYLNYLHERPDSVVAALRVMGRSQGSALVHCAAGKDRTGVVVALALEVADVTRDAIIADYVLTGERLPRVLARLKASPTYAADLDGRPDDSHLPRPEIMANLLAHLDDNYGGPLGWLTKHGWSAVDSETLRARLRP
ncbi:MAG TPA: tyrosine-protein phosphatase [Streptosporangiaceae bacterium]|jgi:protein tyrosine/serine phosphatase